MGHTNRAKDRRRMGASGEVSFGDIAAASGISAGLSLVGALVASLIASALCLLSSDPLSLVTPVGLVILYISSAACGFFAAYPLRRDRSAANVSALLSGLLLFLILGIFSTATKLIFSGSPSFFSALVALALRGVSVICALIASFMAVKPRQKPHRRKK